MNVLNIKVQITFIHWNNAPRWDCFPFGCIPLCRKKRGIFYTSFYSGFLIWNITEFNLIQNRNWNIYNY